MVGLGRGEQVLVAGALALVVTGGALLYLREREGKRVSPQVVSPDGRKERESELIKVDVGGAVWKPRVYEVRKGARVEDVLSLAMPRADADLDEINQAQVLRDGEKILIPRKGGEGHDGEGGRFSRLPERRAAKINLNTATREELESLPGIGPVKADLIVDYRETHGRFVKVEDLLKVSGIGEKIYEPIKNRVTAE